MTTRYTVQGYHFLKTDMRSGSSSVRQRKWRVGESRTLRSGSIVPCKWGYHASPTVYDAIRYAPGPILCLVELSGDVTPHGNPIDKWAGRTRRLLAAVNVDRQLREFAADCAEHVLPLFEGVYPNDSRPRHAIEVARHFARGEATKKELEAARKAVEEAARDVARDAAWAAAWEAAGAAAWDAARGAARAAAWDAAWEAARAAAWEAARDAVRGAARAAAWAAAWNAARDAAGDVAWEAARDIAWVAARAAEVKWQCARTDRIFLPLLGDSMTTPTVA